MKGTMERVYAHSYTHLSDMHCCMQCGAVPCTIEHDDEAKNNRLKDLQFVLDVCEEKRLIEEAYAALKREVAEKDEKELNWLNEKYAISNRVAELQMEKEKWLSDNQNMKSEIISLKVSNEKYKLTVAELEMDNLKVMSLTQKLHMVEKEMEGIVEERSRYRGIIVSQSDQLVGLNAELDILKGTYAIAKKKADEFDEVVGKMQCDIDDLGKTISEKEGLILEGEYERNRLIVSLDELRNLCNDKDAELLRQTTLLREEMSNLQTALKGAIHNEDSLKREINNLQDSIHRLQARLSSDTRFRAFIDLKRHAENVKADNVILLGAVSDLSNAKSYDDELLMSPNSMCIRASDGRVKSARGRIRQTPEMLVASLTKPNEIKIKTRIKSSKFNYLDNDKLLLKNMNLGQMSTSSQIVSNPSSFAICC